MTQLHPGYSQILRMAVPISFSLLIPQLSFMANAAFLGHLGRLELVVNGLCSIFYLLLTYMGFGLSNGILVLFSRSAGRGDSRSLFNVFSNGAMLVIFGALCLMFLSFWISPLIFGLGLEDELVFYKTLDFLYLRLWGLPFLMITQLINVFFISINRSRLLIYGAVVANALIIFFDYTLIFGNWGFPYMGLEGAAISSIIGEAGGLLTAVLMLYFKKLLPFRLSLQALRPDWKTNKKILIISSPLIVQYIFSIGGWQLFYIYIEHLGITELAVSHILRSVLGIVSIGTWALASTCNTMVSNLLGQGRPDAVVALVKRIILLSLCFALVLSVLLQLFPTDFLAFYTDEQDVVAAGLKSLKVLSYSILVMSVATVCFNALVGMGRTLVNLLVEVACVLLYVVYIIIVIEKMRMPLHIAWASEFVYWGFLLLVAGGYLFSGIWKRDIRRDL